MEFRIVQQGYTAPLLCNSLSMRYGSPTLAHPSHCIEVEQRDLATSKAIPNLSLAYEERQKAMLVRHHQLHPEPQRESSFHHARTEILELNSLQTTALFDSWQGSRRLNHMGLVMKGSEQLVIVMSGMDKAEALGILERLVPATSEKSLANWHDA